MKLIEKANRYMDLTFKSMFMTEKKCENNIHHIHTYNKLHSNFISISDYITTSKKIKTSIAMIGVLSAVLTNSITNINLMNAQLNQTNPVCIEIYHSLNKAEKEAGFSDSVQRNLHLSLACDSEIQHAIKSSVYQIASFHNGLKKVNFNYNYIEDLKNNVPISKNHNLNSKIDIFENINNINSHLDKIEGFNIVYLKGISNKEYDENEKSVESKLTFDIRNSV